MKRVAAAVARRGAIPAQRGAEPQRPMFATVGPDVPWVDSFDSPVLGGPWVEAEPTGFSYIKGAAENGTNK